MNKKQLITIKILDEINVVFIGLKAHQLSKVVDKFSRKKDGYHFSPKYKLGVWDGKIQFFYKTGKTYLQLVPEILEFLGTDDFRYKIIDKRKIFDVTVPEIDENFLIDYGITLGEHQVLGINELTQNQGGIYLGGTGAGKTICAAALTKIYYDYLKLKTIIIVPSADLVEQTIDELLDFFPSVGEYSGNKKDYDHFCVVSTWQALQNNVGILSKFQVAIVDECHGTKADVLKNILNNSGSSIMVKVGVTGTLPETEVDRMNVKVTLGVVRYEAPAHMLMEKGWLAKLNLNIIQLREDLREEYQQYYETTKDSPKKTYATFKNNFFSEYTEEKKYIQNNKKRNEWIAQKTENYRKRKKGNTFILVNGVAYGKRLKKLIPDSHFIYGDDETKVRKEIFKLFDDNNDIVVISTFQLASTGLNIKRIFNLLLIDAGKGFIRIIQSIGRGLRKAHDKDEVNVDDICSDLKYAKRHLSSRIRHYTSQKYKFKKEIIDY
jgi:superfamily II DNA or RNA helicase